MLGLSDWLVLSLETFMPNEWLALVWGRNEGPQFSSLEQANHILQLVMKHMSGMIPSLMAEPQEFRLCSTSAGNSRAGSTSAKEWCTGFMQGMTLRDGSEPTKVDGKRFRQRGP
jgi:uncharacterized protein